MNKNPWESTEHTPKLTGIPSNVVIISEMEKLKRRSDSIRDNIRTDMNDVVDSKLNVDSSDYKKIQYFQKLPTVIM